MKGTKAQQELSFCLLESLVAGATLRSFKKEAIVVNEGDEALSMYFIMSGRVRVFLSNADGDQITLCELKRGDYFGELALFHGARSASVMTLEPSVFACVRAADAHSFLRQNPDALLEVTKRLMERNMHSNRQLKAIALLDVYGRLSQLLMDLSENVEGVCKIAKQLTQQDIASRIGCSREMVGKILRDLSTGGYISITRQELRILRRLPDSW